MSFTIGFNPQLPHTTPAISSKLRHQHHHHQQQQQLRLHWPLHTPQQLRKSHRPSSPPRSSAADHPAELRHVENQSHLHRSGETAPPAPPANEVAESKSFWKKWQTNAAEMQAQVAKLGLAAVLAYGLFDGVTYTTFFILAFLGYEKSTGKNPAANIQGLLGIVILMWTGNNVTRPLRVAGAAALAPFIDKALKKIQHTLKLPNQLFAFMVVVASFASLCLSIVGFLILSRWGN